MKDVMMKNIGEEFNINNVPLPDYDPVDMSLLLGAEFKYDESESAFSKFKREVREEVAACVQRGEVLLQESEVAMRDFKDRGIFLHFFMCFCWEQIFFFTSMGLYERMLLFHY
ncbi:unnamed protein product [Gongylonema pulchrum]|uniref:Histone acetyltransferase n=1 Tax=Gongylonema pulchrum TaxID=637853 RepID=A0A183EZY6_9BILA|nr:unnamed protein product [Gongylonema pulchrum]